jgi:amylosucrase
MTILESPALPSHSDEALSVWRIQLNAAPQNRARVLVERIRKQESVLTDRLVKVYGQHPNVDALVQDLIQAAVQASLARAEDLWQLDLHRQAHPDWHQQGAVGYTAYVDQFAGNLQGITEKLTT